MDNKKIIKSLQEKYIDLFDNSEAKFTLFCRSLFFGGGASAIVGHSDSNVEMVIVLDKPPCIRTSIIEFEYCRCIKEKGCSGN